MATGLTIPSDTIFSPSERGMWIKDKIKKYNPHIPNQILMISITRAREE